MISSYRSATLCNGVCSLFGVVIFATPPGRIPPPPPADGVSIFDFLKIA
jgi:hypothetical protein